jgi:hypothetical protein
MRTAPTSQDATLETIIALSRELLSLVESDQWSKAASIEAERQVNIKEYLSTSPADQDLERHQQVFKALLDLNGTVMSLLRERRQDLVRDLRSAEQGRAAVRAYTGIRE